jgi:hypothetical protein
MQISGERYLQDNQVRLLGQDISAQTSCILKKNSP